MEEGVLGLGERRSGLVRRNALGEARFGRGVITWTLQQGVVLNGPGICRVVPS